MNECAETASNTPSRTLTPSITLTPSRTLTPSVTFTPTRTFTASSTPSRTLTPSVTFTPSRTFTASNTPSRTLTPSVTFTPTRTFTASNTPTRTFTSTATATATLTATATRTATATSTATATPTASATATATLSPLVQCQIRYLAHASAGEVGAGSFAALIGIMMSQINYFNTNGSFYGFRLIVEFINASTFPDPAPTRIPDDAESQRRYAYSGYIDLCQRGLLSEPSSTRSPLYRPALTPAHAMFGNLSNPLSTIDLNASGVTAEDQANLAFLDDVSNSGFTQEKGVGVTRSVVEYWAQQGLWDNLPAWWPPELEQRDPIVFWGDPVSVVVHEGAAPGLPLIWYCPNSYSNVINGITNYALTYAGPTSYICGQCIEDTIVRHEVREVTYIRQCSIRVDDSHTRQIGWSESGEFLGQ